MAAALAAFGASLTGPFVFDDFALLNDPAIAASSGWRQCWRLAQTRPLTWFSFWVSDRLSENPAGFHAVSLLLHASIVLLVWEALRRLIPERAALIAAAIFAIHPVLTEPVSYIFARGTLISALFSLLAIRSWVHGRRWVAAGWFAIAMLGKEECAALPVFLLLLDLSRGKLRGCARPLAAMFAIALALGLRAVWATAVVPGAQAGPQAGVSPFAYLQAQGVVILRYLRMLIVPWGFAIDYPVTIPAAPLAVMAWAALAAGVWLASRRFAGLDAGFWFIAGLVLLAPSSSIFPAADLANDRRMYLPLIALSACGGLLLKRLDTRWLAAAGAVLLAVSIHFASLWRSPEALWTGALRSAPQKIRPRLQLARLVEPARGLALLEEAARLAPSDPAIPAERGRILLVQNQPGEALAAFGRALALDPESAAAMNNRGVALEALGQTAAAEADFARALARDPCLFDARLNLMRLGVRTGAPGWCHYTERQRLLLAGR